MKILHSLLAILAMSLSAIHAASFDSLAVDGNVNVGGSIFTNATGGYIKAKTFLESGQNLVVGTFITTGNYIQAGGYITSAGAITAATNITATSGAITASGNITSNTGHIYAADYLQAGTYVRAPTGTFTNLLQTGGSTASGNLSTALGAATLASSYSSVVIGRYNLNTAKDGSTGPSGTAWLDGGTVGSPTPVDPLFEVGNGTDATHPKNAFTIYKDGTVRIPKRQGDIMMGDFGNTGD